MVDAAVALRPDLGRDALSIVVTGKLVETRHNDGVFYTTILGARPDEYSQPVPFEVRSRRQLGKHADIVTVACRVGGFFRRSYKVKGEDPRGNDDRVVRPIVMTLDHEDL